MAGFLGSLEIWETVGAHGSMKSDFGGGKFAEARGRVLSQRFKWDFRRSWLWFMSNERKRCLNPGSSRDPSSAWTIGHFRCLGIIECQSEPTSPSSSSPPNLSRLLFAPSLEACFFALLFCLLLSFLFTAPSRDRITTQDHLSERTLTPSWAGSANLKPLGPC